MEPSSLNFELRAIAFITAALMFNGCPRLHPASSDISCIRFGQPYQILGSLFLRMTLMATSSTRRFFILSPSPRLVGVGVSCSKSKADCALCILCTVLLLPPEHLA